MQICLILYISRGYTNLIIFFSAFFQNALPWQIILFFNCSFNKDILVKTDKWQDVVVVLIKQANLSYLLLDAYLSKVLNSNIIYVV